MISALKFANFKKERFNHPRKDSGVLRWDEVLRLSVVSL